VLPAHGRQFESVVMFRSRKSEARGRSSNPAKPEEPRKRSRLLDRLMPRHAAFIVGLVLGVLTFAVTFFITPQNSVSLGANALFIGFLFVTFLKMPHLTADYLRKHAREEDTPLVGIFLIVLLVLVASLVSLFLALSGGQSPDPFEVADSVTSVILGWFTVQAMGALHYAYEYYQVDEAPEGEEVTGGLDFQGDQDPDGFDFVYFSYTVGTSVATSDTKILTHKMRRLVTVHLVFSHLFNTIILAAAVNVLISLGGGGG
jgi:uncharacterized membrane protein